MQRNQFPKLCFHLCHHLTTWSKTQKIPSVPTLPTSNNFMRSSKSSGNSNSSSTVNKHLNLLSNPTKNLKQFKKRELHNQKRLLNKKLSLINLSTHYLTQQGSLLCNLIWPIESLFKRETF